jgi:hypothetical protein
MTLWLRVGGGMTFASLSLAMAAGAVTFGEQGTGNDAINLNQDFLTATQFTCPASGSVNRIVFYVPITAGASGRVALYGSGGVNLPGALLAESASQALVTGWNTFVISSTAVTGGTTYWLANQVSNNAAFLGIYNDDSEYWKSLDRYPFTYGGYPDPFGSVSGITPPYWRFCIYATEVAPTSTPTPGGTATFTATATRSLTSTPSPVYSPTMTPTITPTRTRTPTPSATRTMSRTATISPTATISATSTRSPVYSPTQTCTITLSSTITSTPTITPTLTISLTQTVVASYSATATLTTAIISGTVRIFPQPGRERVRLSYPCSGVGRVTVEVFNAVGECVLRVKDEPVSQGNDATTELATQDLAAGVYYLRIQIEDQQGRRVLKGKMAVAQ